ncbi:MAG: hypothetical protein ACJ76F_07250 [Bacteroidia bacterium]
MEEQNFKPEESLKLIQSMINRAQNNISENGFLLIFWGWLVFLSALVFYMLLKMENQYAGLVWLAMPAGGIFTMIYSIKKSRKEKVRSYIDDYMAFVWIAFGAGLLITLCMGQKMQLNCYPMVIMLYGIATFITGGMIRFKPLIICGALSFPISVFAFFVTFEYQILLLALSLLISYIIPGHLLQAKFKSHGATERA